ncbi:MAG: hypothetical protein ACOCWM_05170 [Cyclobacteriaceae bacterium]
MKIKILLFTLLISFCFFYECGLDVHKSKRTDAIFDEIVPESEEPIILQYYTTDSIALSLDVLEPRMNLNPLLDSILDITLECPNPRKESEFTSIKCFSFCVSESMDLKNVRISTMSMHRSDFTRFNSYFDYKGYRFYYWGKILDEFFIKTNDISTEMYVDPNSLVFSPDDRDYYWTYILKDKILHPISYKNCMRLWVRND